jgi:hypothetical protein
MPGIAAFHDYLTNLKSPSDFSGPKLVEIMDSFQKSFEAHMHSEIATLAQLTHHPRTAKEGSAEEQATHSSFERSQGKNLFLSGLTDVMPFFLFNFDREYEDGLWMNWPPIPGPVRWILISAAKVLHPGWWKFASCDSTGRRKELHAVPLLKKEVFL